MPNVADTSKLDMFHINRELDRCKTKIFLSGQHASFFGSLMCSLEFQWTYDIATAATDGVKIWWNVDHFLGLDIESRTTVLQHELWHVARLHMLRRGARDPRIWNHACDTRINNDLKIAKQSFVGLENCIMDPEMDKPELRSEEAIYDLLMQDPPPDDGGGSFGGGDIDMLPTDPDKHQQVVNRVVQAVQQAKMSGNPGAIPGGIEEVISTFLDPVVPWEKELMDFFTDLQEKKTSWRRPNRRYPNMYMPSRIPDEGRLAHLMYFMDVSGSVSSSDAVRFNSELKYVHDVIRPKKLTIVQFDTVIQQVDEFTEEDEFNKIKIVGRGGTSLVCVRKYIEEHEPTAAVVFSDMQCSPMDPLSIDCPVIWAILGNKGCIPPFGKAIHIK